MQTKSRLGSLISLTILFAGLLVIYLNRLSLYDWWRLRDYQPSSQVVQLANADTMTDYARHMFYINRPTIQNKEQFNLSCPNDGGEQTIILGCYHDKQTGIFLFSVTDPKLNGVEQVTAAHETLHAVYERLSSKDKTYIDGLLQDFFNNGLKDKRIRATIESYRQTEPNDVVNEMHSVFGTEVKNLPTVLEDYYAKYFKDRKTVAGFAERYQQAFTNNQTLGDKYLAQIKHIEQSLNSLKQQIDSQEAALRAQANEIESQRKNVTDVSAFNAEVNSYNAQVVTYRSLISKYNSQIDEHNNLVAKYQALTIETNQLIQELDSRSASVPSQ